MAKDRSISLGRGVSVRQVGGWYHLRFRDKRRTPQERSVALDTDALPLAMERAREKVRRYENGAWDPWKSRGRELPITALVKAYRKDRAGVIESRTLDNYVAVFEKFLTTVPRAQTLPQIRPEQLKAFVYGAGLSQASRRSYYRKLHVLFEWFVQKGHLEANPLHEFEKPRDYKPVPKALKGTELTRLLAAVETWFDKEHGCEFIHRRERHELWARDAFEVMAWTGLRPAELVRLRWSEVHWSSGRRPGYLHIESRTKRKEQARTKGGHDNLKTLLPQAEAVLRRIERDTRRSTNPDELVLKGPDGMSGVSAGYLSGRFRHFRDEAKLPKSFSLYSLRHTFAAEYMRRGGSIFLLKDEMGHRELRTTEKYAQLDSRERMDISHALFARKDVRKRVRGEMRGKRKRRQQLSVAKTKAAEPSPV